MERRRPEDSQKEFAPLIDCSSIYDLVSSKDEIINLIEMWKKYEATRVAKLVHNLSGEALAYIELPNVRHSPTIDEQAQSGNQITLFDGSTNFPIFVNLPNPILLKAINYQRVKSGLFEISKKALKENFWTADVSLYAIYNKKGTSFNLQDLEQIDITDSKPELIRSTNIIFKPHII